MKIKKENNKEIIKKFGECKNTETVNWEHEDGFLYLAGGILSKLDENNHQSIAIKGRWVRV